MESSAPPSPSPRRGNWLRRTIRQAPWRTQTQTSSLLLAGVVLMGVIGAMYLAQASRTAATGRRLQELIGERARLEQQNAQLRAEIAALRSVPRLIRQSQAMGYRAAGPDEVYYLEIEGIGAPLPTPDAFIVEPEPVPTYDETLESWLSHHFKDFQAQLGRLFGGGEVDSSPQAPQPGTEESESEAVEQEIETVPQEEPSNTP